MNKSTIFVAMSLLAAPFAQTAHADQAWIKVEDLCFDWDDNPLTCETDSGQTLATASFTDTTWQADYQADVGAICREKVRAYMNDPNWPEARIGSGCGVNPSYWYPEGTPCPSDGFCPRTREAWNECCTDTRWIGSSIDDMLSLTTGNGAHIAFETLFCSCSSLVDTPD